MVNVYVKKRAEAENYILYVCVTCGLTDCQQLAVLLSANVFSIISFERHLAADPLQ